MKDWTGERKGRLVYIERTNVRDIFGHIQWKAECDCGQVIYVVPSQPVKSCGCLHTESANRARNGYTRNERMFSPLISSARAIWKKAYRDCDFDTFFALSQQPCHYCGSEPQNAYNVGDSRMHTSELQIKEGNFIYNGLDRVDNFKGHSPDNVVPCCKRCNYIKGAFSLEDFLSHLERMYEHTSSLREKTLHPTTQITA